MLYNSRPSPYDLNFRLLGVPICVQPMFWLFCLIFGSGWMRVGIEYLLLYMVVIFISFIVHEMGHVLMGRAFGEPGHIVLSSFFGLAIGNYHRLNRWQRIAISAAGPAGNFLLVGLSFALGQYLVQEVNLFHLVADNQEQGLALFAQVRGWIVIFAYMLLYTNLVLGIFNLFPVFPLDGGQISQNLCSIVSPRRGEGFALGLSLLLAGLFAVYSGIKMARPDLPYPPFDPLFNVFFFGFLAVLSWQMLQMHNSFRGRFDDESWRY